MVGGSEKEKRKEKEEEEDTVIEVALARQHRQRKTLMTEQKNRRAWSSVQGKEKQTDKQVTLCFAISLCHLSPPPPPCLMPQ